MKNLRQSLHNPVLGAEEREEMKARVVTYLSLSKVSHRLYGRRYITVYITAVLILVLNILATDFFLDHKVSQQ